MIRPSADNDEDSNVDTRPSAAYMQRPTSMTTVPSDSFDVCSSMKNMPTVQSDSYDICGPMNNTTALPSTPTRRKQPSLIQRLNPLRRFSFSSKDKRSNNETNHVISSPTKKITPTNPKDDVLAEIERVKVIKEMIDAKKHTSALAEMMADTDEDLHYFNKVKLETLGEQHMEHFSNKHGKLLDFESRPPPIEEHNICIWRGESDYGHPLRCHNKCLYHPIEVVTDQLGVDHPKQMNFCVYHVRYCVNTTKHEIPMKIRIPNEDGLCNECYTLRHNQPPKALLRVPGTRRIRS